MAARKYTLEFKRSAVQLVNQQGYTPAQAAKSLGVDRQRVVQWVEQFGGVQPGHYMHFADSFHIYGSYFDEFDGFRATVSSRCPSDRVFTTDFALPFFLEGCDSLLSEPDMPEPKKHQVRLRKAELEARG